MPRRDLEKIIDEIEDAKTSVEEVRDRSLPQEENDDRLQDVENTLASVTDDLDEIVNQRDKD